jgi:hypothetical protein
MAVRNCIRFCPIRKPSSLVRPTVLPARGPAVIRSYFLILVLALVLFVTGHRRTAYLLDVGGWIVCVAYLKFGGGAR